MKTAAKPKAPGWPRLPAERPFGSDHFFPEYGAIVRSLTGPMGLSENDVAVALAEIGLYVFGAGRVCDEKAILNALYGPAEGPEELKRREDIRIALSDARSQALDIQADSEWARYGRWKERKGRKP